MPDPFDAATRRALAEWRSAADAVKIPLQEASALVQAHAAELAESRSLAAGFEQRREQSTAAERLFEEYHDTMERARSLALEVETFRELGGEWVAQHFRPLAGEWGAQQAALASTAQLISQWLPAHDVADVTALLRQVREFEAKDFEDEDRVSSLIYAFRAVIDRARELKLPPRAVHLLSQLLVNVIGGLITIWIVAQSGCDGNGQTRQHLEKFATELTGLAKEVQRLREELAPDPPTVPRYTVAGPTPVRARSSDKSKQVAVISPGHTVEYAGSARDTWWLIRFSDPESGEPRTAWISSGHLVPITNP